MTRRISSISKGFVMKSNAPFCIASTTGRTEVDALTMMTGRSGYIVRASRRNSIPSFTGMTTSRSRRSTRSAFRTLEALSALSTVVTGENLLFESSGTTGYFVVVEGKTSVDSGSYDLEVLCSSVLSGELCTNALDDDGDGDVDCDDSDCTHLSICP